MNPKPRRPLAEPFPWVWAGLLFVVPLVLFARTLGMDFIWDDDANVTQNALLYGEDQLRRIWTGQDIYQYYPLTFTSYWLQGQVWDLSARSCHAVNLVLHALNGVLLFGLLRVVASFGRSTGESNDDPAGASVANSGKRSIDRAIERASNGSSDRPNASASAHQDSNEGWPLGSATAWAFAAAFLFVVHPVGVESVAWITERKNLLSGAFALAASWTFLSRGRSVGGWALSLLLFVCAVLSKTHTVVLPAVLWLLVWWRRSESHTSDNGGAQPFLGRLSLAPFFVVSAVASWITVRFETAHVVRDGAEIEWSLSLADKVVNAGRIATFYLGKIVWPTDLSFIYPQWQVDGTALGQWVYVFGWAVAVVVAWAMRDRVSRWVLVAVLGYLITLAPVMGFARVYFMRYAYVQDHFAYFALMVAVPALLAGAGILGQRAFASFTSRSLEASNQYAHDSSSSRPLETSARGEVEDSTSGASGSQVSGGGDQAAGRTVGPAVSGVVVAVLALACSAASWQKMEDFRDLETLWRRTTEKNPSAWMAWTNLGVILVGQGRFAEAAEHHRKAIAIDDSRAEPHNNLGTALEALGDLEGAAASYARAVEIEPNDPVAHYNLGNAQARQGQWRDAMASFEQALSINREYPQALNGLAVTLAQTGRMQAAMEHWAEALVVAPTFKDAYDNLGRALETEIAPAQGATMMQQMSQRTGGKSPSVEVLHARAWLRFGNFESAILAIDAAESRLSPGSPEWLRRAADETRRAVGNVQ